MRDRFHALVTQARGKFHHFCKVTVRGMRDVNAFSGRHNIGEASDPLRLDGGSFDRVVLDELLYGQLIHFPAGSTEASTPCSGVRPEDDDSLRHRQQPGRVPEIEYEECGQISVSGIVGIVLRITLLNQFVADLE